MITFALYLVAAVLTIVILLVAWRYAQAYCKFRGVRLVTCPETAKPTAVEVDAKHAVLGGIGNLDLRLKSCSRWPERQDCGQDCVAQIEASPEGCLVRTILTSWYEGKSCVYCGTLLGKIDWLKHKPALMSPDHITFEWKEIGAERVPEVLATHMPVCWSCHVIATFRRRYPDLVVDRPWKPGESHRSS